MWPWWRQRGPPTGGCPLSADDTGGAPLLSAPDGAVQVLPALQSRQARRSLRACRPRETRHAERRQKDHPRLPLATSTVPASKFVARRSACGRFRSTSPRWMLSGLRSATTSTWPTPSTPYATPWSLRRSTGYLVLGPDRAGNLLEVVVMDGSQGPAVIHSMPMQARYQKLLEGRGSHARNAGIKRMAHRSATR